MLPSWKNHFFSRVKVNREQIRLFDGMAPDPEKECGEMEACLHGWGGMDYLLLGMGMNGHLALNEPGDGFDRKAHPVKLSQTTVRVAPKYFPSGMPPISGGITLGIGTLTAGEKNPTGGFGTHKRRITEQLLTNGNPGRICPPAPSGCRRLRSFAGQGCSRRRWTNCIKNIDKDIKRWYFE